MMLKELQRLKRRYRAEIRKTFPATEKMRGGATLQSGEGVRIVGLYQRDDGQFVPTTATVCLRDGDCPVISLPPHAH